MPFASHEQRRRCKEETGIPYTVQVVTREGREFELAADDMGHAVDLRATWLQNHGALSAEIFRVLHDGSLNPVTTEMDE
tara:strand:- start:270 stop:506 length:237 start_codon:yes stop_codon:yes gene_type:complete